MAGDANAGAVVDFHNHVMPGVDDGAPDEATTRAALAAMQADGVHTLIATPHVDASIAARPDRLAERMAELDAGWSALGRVATEFAGLDVRRGAEVKLDTPEPDLSDGRFRLAGGRFVLVEFPYFTIPPLSTRVIAHIRTRGWIPIVAHPERYGGLVDSLELVEEWRAAGAYLQGNGPSVTGRYGEEAREAAFVLLENGWLDYLSSDFHARARPGIAGYRRALTDLDGDAQATLLTETNPARLLRDELPLPVPPLSTRRTLWDRITSPFRG